MAYKILVDIRGKEIKKIKPLLPLMYTPYKIKNTLSDFVLMDGEKVLAVFERKRINDFVSSLGKRLNQQALNMMPYVPAAYIVLVGDLSEIKYVAKMKKMKFSEEHFFGAIASVTIRTGISVLWVKTNAEAIVLIDKMCKKIIEGKFGVPTVTKKNKQKLRVTALSFCWGVRPDISKKLLKEFGSIEGIINATENDFKRLNLSKRMYKSIQEFFRGA